MSVPLSFGEEEKGFLCKNIYFSCNIFLSFVLDCNRKQNNGTSKGIYTKIFCQRGGMLD